MVTPIRGRDRHGLFSAALLIGAAALLLIGCGGGGGGTMSAAEVATKVDAACAKVSGYSVWLPEHLQKTQASVKEGQAILKKADEEFTATLASLDPPSDLRAPIERLSDTGEAPRSRAAAAAYLKRREALYREVGAADCAKGTQASILILGGAAVTDAYRQVGLALPAHPDGW